MKVNKESILVLDLGASSLERHSISKYNKERNYIRGWYESPELNKWLLLDVIMLYDAYVSPKFMDLGATNSNRSSNWTSSRFDLLFSIRMTYQLTGIIDKAYCSQTRYVSPKFMDLGASPKQDLYTTSKVYFMYVYHFVPGSINPKFEVYYAFYVSPIIGPHIYLQSDYYTKFEF